MKKNMSIKNLVLSGFVLVGVSSMTLMNISANMPTTPSEVAVEGSKENLGAIKHLSVKDVSNLNARKVGAIDSDKDGLSDEVEAKIKSDPQKVDTDEDGFSDMYEYAVGTSPILKDSFPKSSTIFEVKGRTPDAEMPEGNIIRIKDSSTVNLNDFKNFMEVELPFEHIMSVYDTFPLLTEADIELKLDFVDSKEPPYTGRLIAVFNDGSETFTGIYVESEIKPILPSVDVISLEKEVLEPEMTETMEQPIEGVVASDTGTSLEESSDLPKDVLPNTGVSGNASVLISLMMISTGLIVKKFKVTNN